MEFPLLIFFIISSVAASQCREDLECTQDEHGQNPFRDWGLNLDCFNSTHLKANWTGAGYNPSSYSNLRLHLDCQTDNETGCVVFLKLLKKASGTVMTTKPNETLSCSLFMCGVYFTSNNDVIRFVSTSNSITFCEDFSTIESSTPFEPHSSTLITYSSSNSYTTSLAHTSILTTTMLTTEPPIFPSTTVVTNTSTTSEITPSTSTVSISLSSQIVSSSEVPTSARDTTTSTMNLSLIIALMIVLIVFLGCTFLFAMAIILVLAVSKRKRNTEENIIYDMSEFAIRQQDSFVKYNPPPKPFTQPLPNDTQTPVHSTTSTSMYSGSSTKDDSVQLFESTTMTRERIDSGFNEHDDEHTSIDNTTNEDFLMGVAKTETPITCSSNSVSSTNQESNDANHDVMGYIVNEPTCMYKQDNNSITNNNKPLCSNNNIFSDYEHEGYVHL